MATCNRHLIFSTYLWNSEYVSRTVHSLIPFEVLFMIVAIRHQLLDTEYPWNPSGDYHSIRASARLIFRNRFKVVALYILCINDMNTVDQCLVSHLLSSASFHLTELPYDDFHNLGLLQLVFSAMHSSAETPTLQTVRKWLNLYLI